MDGMMALLRGWWFRLRRRCLYIQLAEARQTVIEADEAMAKASRDLADLLRGRS